MFFIADMKSEDMFTVMTSTPMHSSSSLHIETDNTLTYTDNWTRLMGAREESRLNTLKPT
jgi:hypothetical protein